jgi:host factor-I protein
MATTGGGVSAANRAQLQDAYLAEAKRQEIAVVVYLVNGFQLRGLVKGFDSFTIVLEYEHRLHLIYKHAVSTISPQAPLTLPE